MADPKLARRMAIKGGISTSQATELADELTAILTEGLLQEGKVMLSGFGSLEIIEQSSQAWNPQKHKRVPRKQKRKARWKPSRKL